MYYGGYKRNLLNADTRQGRSADPFLLANGFFEMSHVCSCASDDTSVEPNPTYSKSQVLNDPRVITDDSFDAVCCLARIGQEIQVNGRWQYKLLLANKTVVPQNIYYFMLWYDEDGKLIATPSPAWVSAVVLSGEYKEIRIPAPSIEARDFRLYLQGRYDVESCDRAKELWKEE